jgi:peroxiredoxin
MPNIKKNQLAPNFNLISTEGEEISLQNLLKPDKNVLLIFLRHLG